MHGNFAAGKCSLEKISFAANGCQKTGAELLYGQMSSDDFVQIQIRCPKCAQRFRVGPELKGRMVECGACEFRFRVDEESLVKNRKFYPGEKKDPTLIRYSRQPHLEVAAPPQMMIAEYTAAPDVERFEPTPLGKIIVGLVGGAVMAITLLILITGGSSNGFLDGVTTDRRMIIAVFAAVVGASMIIYANPRTRAKAIVFALIGAAALIGAPLYFKEGAKELIGQTSNVNIIKAPLIINQGPSDAAELKETVGYGPMETAILEAGQNGRVVGIWLRGLLSSNSELVKTYMMRVSGASESSHLYPRVDQNYLLVLINPVLNLEELALECERMGKVDQTVPELHLIEATVNNALFAEQPIAKLSDKTDGAFYQLNLHELQGMDIRRVNQALLRLSLAEPVQSRDDIIKRMKELAVMSDREMLTNLARALTEWSNGKDEAPEVMMKAAARVYKLEKKLSVEVVSFLTKWQQPEIYPILEELWTEDPTTWEEIFMKSGPMAESHIINHLMTGENRQRMSAAKIASRVGSDAAINALEEALKTTNDLELQTSFQNALEAIKQRNP